MTVIINLNIYPTSKSVKEDLSECFKFFEELIASLNVFKTRACYAQNFHASTSSLRSCDSFGGGGGDNSGGMSGFAPPRRSKSYGSIPNEVFRSLKKNVKKTGSMKNLLRSLHSPLTQTKSFEFH